APASADDVPPPVSTLPPRSVRRGGSGARLRGRLRRGVLWRRAAHPRVRCPDGGGCGAGRHRASGAAGEQRTCPRRSGRGPRRVGPAGDPVPAPPLRGLELGPGRPRRRRRDARRRRGPERPPPGAPRLPGGPSRGAALPLTPVPARARMTTRTGLLPVGLGLVLGLVLSRGARARDGRGVAWGGPGGRPHAGVRRCAAPRRLGCRGAPPLASRNACRAFRGARRGVSAVSACAATGPLSDP